MQNDLIRQRCARETKIGELQFEGEFALKIRLASKCMKMVHC